MHLPRLFLLALAGIGTTFFTTNVSGCPCQSAQAVAMTLPAFSGMPVMHPVLEGMIQAEYWTPPGTIGETYTRPSHPIPVEKHPRTGMLAVRDNSSAPILSVESMGGFRMKNGVWLFESTRPLDFGSPQIVRVEARRTIQDIEPFATKFVRLIPGRIVYLDF